MTTTDRTEAQPPPVEPPRASRPLVVVAVAVGLVVVLLAAVAVWRTVSGGDDEGLEGDEAAQALVEAYTRHLDATFRVEGELTRTMDDGRVLRSAYLTVQRPPDRLQRSLGATSGTVGGRAVNCSTGEGGEYTCAASGAPVDPEADRRRTLDALDSYVLGDDPVYDVTSDGEGCFDLVRRRTEVDATYGRRARICFDPATAAIRRLEVAREGGATDVLLAEVVTTDVTGADFDLSEDDTYDPDVPAAPGSDDGEGTPATTATP